MKTLVCRNIHRLIFAITAILTLFGASACQREDVPLPDQDQEALVVLNIRTPGVTTPKVSTRSESAEYLITEIKILVLEKGEGGYFYRYMAEGQNISQENPGKSAFTARLKGTEKGVKLLIMANYGDSFDLYTPYTGEPEDELRSRIVSRFSSPEPSTIPMYGEVTLDKLETETTNTITATMLRALARTDVRTELDLDLSNSFEITEIYVYRARDLVQVIPDLSAMSESATPKVSSPSVPEGAGAVERLSATVYDPESIEGIYLPECASVTDEEQQLKGVTCLVVGGIYNREATPSYYRVDFDSGEAGHPYGQLLRNHRYEIVITRVTGRGWEDPDDAANNRATMIRTEIQMWEDFTTYMIAGGDNYLGVSSRDMVLSYKEGTQKTLYLQASVPYRISWDGYPETTTAGGGSISGDYFTAIAEELPDAGDDVSKIVFTTLSENNSGSNRTASLTIEWGQWVLAIDVTQLHYVANVE